MLKSTDQERLSKGEFKYVGRNLCISQERGNRIDFVGRMKAGEEKNKKDQALKVKGESTGIEGHLWGNVET